MTKPTKPTKPTQRTPPPGGPPGQGGGGSESLIPIGGIVSVPGVVAAVDRLTAVVEAQKPSTPAPPLNLDELVNAIKANAAAIADHAVAVRDNTAAIGDNTKAIVHHTAIMEEHGDAVVENTEAILGLVEALTPAEPVKATHVTLTAEIEPEGSEEQKMATIQLYPNQVGKVVYTFNGTIDGDPIIIGQGFAVGVTQDPKVETQIDATHVQTSVTAHFRCLQPQNIVEGDPSAPPEHGGTNPGSTWKIGTPCTATVDNPDTGDTVEKIHEEFADTFEWVPLGAGKASAIGMQASIE